MNLMDVTLRDGSYAINFRFSEYDTKNLYQKLDQAHIKYVEIGHGVGMGGGRKGVREEALCTDEEYLKAAQQAEGNAKYGMFCIPGIADVIELERLREFGASFVRIGSAVNEVQDTEEYIKKAKQLGLEVMANYMKSYVATPEEFQESVRKSKEYGADVIYIVDSAGNMNTDDIMRYYEVLRKEGDIKTGFHGHNNLGLAVSNSLFAIKMGFDFVDTSLSGMGRSAGNAATELVVANLNKERICNPYDCKKLVLCAEKYVKPIYKNSYNALDIYCGIAGFHTSYMKYIHKYCSKYQVDPLDLIVEYAKQDKVNMDEKLLEQLACKMAVDLECDDLAGFGFEQYFGSEQK